MSQANLEFSKGAKYPPPCQYVEKIIYDTDDFDLDMGKGMNNTFPHEDFWGNANDSFNIMEALQSPKFKVILHKKAYDLQALVGNCGGYIGLILGKFKK